jgi:hypothetical protein
MSDYRPCQHVVQAQGDEHKTVYANVELWVDKPPDALLIGGYRWVREDEPHERRHLPD